MSLTKKDRMNRSVSGRTFHPDRFPDAIALALHREYGGTHAAIKTVVELTGANQRAVKNWFDATNGPNGAFLIALCRHSNQVLDTFLSLAGRRNHLRAKKLADAKDTLRQILVLMSELDDE